MPLSEPAASLTDLALGLIALVLALRLRGTSAGRRHWTAAFGWTALAALSGAVHHGVVTYSERWSDTSWAIISGMVVIAISYILAATVREVLGPGRWVAFWILRSASLVLYAGVAIAGHAGIEAILSCEGVTMAAVLWLWGLALRRGHPRARAVIVALVASMLAAAVRGAPYPDLGGGWTHDAFYHLAQIPGLVLLYLAVRDRPVSEAPPSPRPEPLTVGSRTT
jgi:uncharacterized protein DUF6962